jgi:molybdopterin molybdotransferase
VRVQSAPAPGQHIRRAGSDVRPGVLVAGPGEILRAPLVGMLAALGRTQVAVRLRPRVAVLATGDELVEPDRLRADGRIASSNSYALAAALREIGAEPVYLGIAPDEPDAIAAQFRTALACDAVISTGGVSVGDRDWIKQVLASLGGSMRLWRIRMKPGAPLAFVTVGERPVFGLPGNPVSTLVTFEQFVRPCLLRMMGHTRVYRPVESAVLDEGYEKPAGRAHFVRVTLSLRAGALHARPTGDQSSNVLLSMVRADGLAFVPEDATRVAAGARVSVQRIHSDDLRDEPGF